MRHHFLGKTGIAVNDFIQRGVTKHRQPQQGKGKRDDQRTEHELADGTTAGDTRKEQADKRRPRHPPGPEEERPAVHPLRRAVKGKGVQRHAHKAVDVIAHVQHQRVEQEIRFAHKQHKQDQPERQRDIQLRKDANAFIDAGGDRNGGDNHRQHNQRHLRG